MVEPFYPTTINAFKSITSIEQQVSRSNRNLLSINLLVLSCYLLGVAAAQLSWISFAAMNPMLLGA